MMKLPPKKTAIQNKSERTWKTRLDEAAMVPKKKSRKKKRVDAKRLFVIPKKTAKKLGPSV